MNRIFMILMISIGLLSTSSIFAISYNGNSVFTGYPYLTFSGTQYSVTNEASISTLTGDLNEFFQVFNTVFLIDESDTDGNIATFVVNGQGLPCHPSGRVGGYISLDWQKPNVVLSVYECIGGSYNTLFTGSIMTLDDPFNSYGLDPDTYGFSFQPYFAGGDNPSSPYTAGTYFLGYTIVSYNESDGKAIYKSVFFEDGQEYKITSQGRPSYDTYTLYSYHNSYFNTAHYGVDTSLSYNYLNAGSGSALNFFFYGTGTDSLMHFFGATGFSGTINENVPTNEPIDYFADCTSFLDVGCYIEGFSNMISDKVTNFIGGFFPDIEWTGNSSSCITFSGSTASGVLSPIAYSGSSEYIQNIVNMVSLMLPFPPVQGAGICLIGGSDIWGYIYPDASDGIVEIEYGKYISDEMRISSFGNLTVFDLFIFVIVGFGWMHLLKPHEQKQNITTGNITTK